MKAKGDFDVFCGSCGEILVEFKDPDHIIPEGCNGREGRSIMITCKRCSDSEKKSNAEFISYRFMFF